MTQELKDKLAHYRLNEEEYQLICDKLGREPQGVEWALFSALWSEHCSYKSSRVHLKKFFNKADHVLEAEGENAGVVDLGQGERIAFKMESHNHPSFIEPFQGAATGVGGILRDIFTMGARPIALADFLCFGELKADRMSTLVQGVVSGIGHYGNCVGVPTITGQTEFHERYNENILVNAMAVGLFEPEDKVFLSKAEGVGNWVVYVGAKTGRDGIHGASMASESFDEDSESKRPTIQIGDPFYEKLLIESCLEVMKQDLVVAIQDMGAAGITSSSFEMASKGQVGMDIHLDHVPLRDESMTPEDILLSESQERMLLVCRPDQFGPLNEVFTRWGLDATKIGEITEGTHVKLFWKNELLTDIDPEHLVEEAPRYERPYKPWSAKNRADEVINFEQPPREFLIELLGQELGGNKEWIYHQYDQRVGARTVQDATHSVGIQRLPSGRFLAVATGCRPHVIRFDAEVGGFDAVALPALQMAAQGFKPLAVTDCLNFGNPEKEETMTDFVACVETISDLCRTINTPVVSGNVSFYNETKGRNITSTPACGLIGMADEVSCGDLVEEDGLTVFAVKLPLVEFGGKWADTHSSTILGKGGIDAKRFAKFMSGIQQLAVHPDVHAQRVVGNFGRAYQLTRFLNGHGFVAEKMDWQDWIKEDLYEVMVACRSDIPLNEILGEGIEIARLGVIQGDQVQLNAEWSYSVEELTGAYASSLESCWKGTVR